jgi:hypothetical protein
MKHSTLLILIATALMGQDSAPEGKFTELQIAKFEKTEAQAQAQKAIYEMNLAPIVSERNAIIVEACLSIHVPQDAIDRGECKVNRKEGYSVKWVKPVTPVTTAPTDTKKEPTGQQP